ncbi:hypothetical protein NQ318_003474 [Aromia moschata]|uniref:Uncharacterized protein n=1 Tax=Aromia moschata TaxID=1265417 RepID=A0AAV8YV25_9CUCU|nr:hypothetical protein NQ318_003474 [Aromia moschata]
MPGNQSTDNGIYEYEENTYFSEGLDNNGIEEYNAPPDNDFSEYLWMENEEEFDKEVHSEKTNRYAATRRRGFDGGMHQAFMNDENNSETRSNQQGNEPSPESVANSKLNPEAAEFVPSSRRTPPEIPATTSS